MDMNQLSKDAAAIKPKARPVVVANPAPQTPDLGPEALWLADTASTDSVPPAPRALEVRVATPEVTGDVRRRREPSMQMPAVEEQSTEPSLTLRDSGGFNMPAEQLERQSAMRATSPQRAQPALPSSAAVPGVELPESTITVGAPPDAEPNPPAAVPTDQPASDEQPPAKPGKAAQMRKKLFDLIGREKAKRAAKAAAEKQKEDDEKNKKASVKKRNFALPATIGVLTLIALAVFLKHQFQDMEKAAGVTATGDVQGHWVADATALLTGSGGAGSSNGAQMGGQVQSNGPVAIQAEKSPEHGQAEDTAHTQFSPPPPPAKSGDPYLDKLRELRGELNANGGVGKSASKLPAEIASQPVPGAGVQARSARQQFREQAAPEEQLVPIPDDIEASAARQAARRDPLDRVAVIGRLAVERNGVAPYAVAQIRSGSAFIYPKNSDPLLTGRWLQVGDQTDDGWTIVAISELGVNVVSPRGRVFEIKS